MNTALRLTLLFLFFMIGFSCSVDKDEINWEEVVCHDVDDDDLLKANINNYLESIDPDITSTLIVEFTEWLNDLTCTGATLVCHDCLNTEPPGSLLKMDYVLEGDTITKELVILLLEEAKAIRLSEIR